MSILFFHWVISGSILSTVAYVLYAWSKNKVDENFILKIVAFLVSAAGFLGGINFIAETCKKIMALTTPMNLDSEIGYTLLGGILIIWMVGTEIVKKIKELNTT